MANKYGMFQEPSYISISDPYMKKVEENSRNLGLNMKAAVEKTGRNNDATFSRFMPLYNGEKFEETYQEKRTSSQKKKSQNITESPFRPANPQKNTCGVGNYYGCIGPRHEHKKDFDETRKSKGDYNVGPRNVVTNPPSKGTYGMRGTTLGEKSGATGVVGEFHYSHDSYDASRKKEIEDRKNSIKARMTDKPFKPASPPKKGGSGVPGRTLGGKGSGVCEEYAYIENGPGKHNPEAKLDVPFRPSHPPKGGYNSTLNRFPNYIEDPLDLKLKSEKAAKFDEIARMNAQPKFIPSYNGKSGPTASILRKNLT